MVFRIGHVSLRHCKRISQNEAVQEVRSNPESERNNGTVVCTDLNGVNIHMALDQRVSGRHHAGKKHTFFLSLFLCREENGACGGAVG